MKKDGVLKGEILRSAQNDEGQSYVTLFVLTLFILYFPT